MTTFYCETYAEYRAAREQCRKNGLFSRPKSRQVCFNCRRGFLGYVKNSRCDKCAWIAAGVQSKARALVTKAISEGHLLKASAYKCVDCGWKAAQWEHRDYTKPLDVQPVCRSCNCRRGPGLIGTEPKVAA